MKKNKPRGYWLNNPQRIYREALKYKKRKDFERFSGSANSAARILGIHEDVCKHMKRCQIFWTKETARVEALKYTNKKDFREQSKSAYSFVSKHKLFDTCCPHFEKTVSTFEKLLSYLKVSLKYNDYKKFKDENPKIIKWANWTGLTPIITYHLTNRMTPYNKFEIIKIALKYNNKHDFRLKEVKAHRIAKKLKILDEVCVHMIPPKKYFHPLKKKFFSKRITLKEIKKEVIKYKTRQEFYEKNRSLHHYCKNNKLYNKVCTHMPKNAKLKHTFKDILNKARKCKTISEFRVRYPKEHKAAHRKKFINKICQIVDFEHRDYSISIGEKTTLHYINKLLNINLKPINNLSWLKNNGYQLRLDGYDEKNKIAFEYNGFRHLKERERKTDAKKRKLCKKYGVILIVIKEYKYIKTYHYKKDIPIAVKKECDRLNLIIVNTNAKIIIKTNSSHMNINKIKKAISECTTLLEFTKKHKRMYRFITTYRLNHLLKKLKRQFTILAKDDLLKVAETCKDIKELRKNYPKEYNALYRRRLFKETKFANLNLDAKIN